ncbi:MAG TPA: 50S ribosomal protein L9 [Bacteroidia bacterium]|nr:50S ribosomal protein L9 [Bacteroidia bacterium]
MEVILKQDVRNLGYKNDIVKVKDGYGRNFLIPRGLAIVADLTAKKVHSENMRQSAHKEAKIKAEAEKSAAKIQEMTVKVGAKAGENGKIFGSVTGVQLADALRKLGFEVERRNISIENEANIKTLGTYNAKVRLHKEVVAPFRFEVVSE